MHVSLRVCVCVHECVHGRACVCVCARARARARACVRVRARACARMRVRLCACACACGVSVRKYSVLHPGTLAVYVACNGQKRPIKETYVCCFLNVWCLCTDAYVLTLHQ